MGTGIAGTVARGRFTAALLLAALLLTLAASAASASTWLNETAMKDETYQPYRDTFIYDPGPGNEIDRSLFVQAPLRGYYEDFGFDANFLTWAPVVQFDPGSAEWSSCHAGTFPQPCPEAFSANFHPVSFAIASGPITALKWGDAFIGKICGNFTQGGAAGPTPTLSGVKYEDLNGDGQREAGEPGLGGWTMHLLYEGNVVATTTTAADGSYAFALDADHLPIGAGAYQVEEVQQAGWVNSQSPNEVTVALGAGDQTYGGNDFGNYRPAVISGHKFDDGNVDGLWNGAEPGLADWTIRLSDGASATTAADGSYSFSVRPGTYTLQELLQDGWRQTSPGGDGARTYTVQSGDVVSDADFGNVCLGGVGVRPVDDSTGDPLAGLEVRIEEVSVPGILANDPSLPITTTGTPTFGELLPGTYRIVAFLPDGVFTTDPDVTVVDGRFAVVKQVTVDECRSTDLPLHFFTASSGKVTGGVKIGLGDGGFGTSGFEFMTGDTGPRGTLQYNDHATGLDLHTSTIEGIRVDGDVAWVWGRVTVGGGSQRFLLRLVDAGEPGTADRYELTLASGYTAGIGETLTGGNVQIHT